MTAPDPGLADERTRLAWRRTLLGTLAVMLLALSHVTNATPAAAWVVALMTGCWLGIVAIANRRMNELRDGARNRVTRSPALVALLVTGYTALAIALVLLP